MFTMTLRLLTVVLWCSQAAQLQGEQDLLNQTRRESVKQICDQRAWLLPHSPHSEVFLNGSVIKGGGCVFPTRIVLLGSQGAGKSSLANSFLGWTKEVTGKLPFHIGHGVQAGTLESSYASGAWLGKRGSPGVTVVDTPGFNSSIQQMEDMLWLLAELEEVNLFVLVFRYRDRLSADLAASLKSVGRLLGKIWSNLAIVVSFWSFNPLEEADREARRINQKRYSEQLIGMTKDKLNIDTDLPVFYIDSHYDPGDLHEVRMFKSETRKFWELLKNLSPWQSLPPAKLKEQMRRVRRRTGELKERCQMYAEDLEELKLGMSNQKSIIRHQDATIQEYRDTINRLKRNCYN